MVRKSGYWVISNSCYKRHNWYVGDYRFNSYIIFQECILSAGVLLALVMLGIAGTAVFLYIFHMRKQKEYVEYRKEKEIFSFCEQAVEKMEKSEDKDKMRIYVIKARMSYFRQQ